MAATGVNQDRDEAAGNIRTEEMITGVEEEGEIRTEERKEIYVLGQRLWQPTHARTQRAL